MYASFAYVAKNNKNKKLPSNIGNNMFCCQRSKIQDKLVILELFCQELCQIIPSKKVNDSFKKVYFWHNFGKRLIFFPKTCTFFFFKKNDFFLQKYVPFFKTLIFSPKNVPFFKFCKYDSLKKIHQIIPMSLQNLIFPNYVFLTNL